VERPHCGSGPRGQKEANMSVAKSFFDITTGRSHGVIPTSDAVRIVLDAGATLILEKACACEDACRGRKCACPPPPASRTLIRAEAADRRDGELWASATGERVDQALSALVSEMVLGEAGVEVTEWAIQAAGGEHRTDVKHVQFGRIRVPLFTCECEDDIAGKLVRTVEKARRSQSDRINAVVVRLPGTDEVGIACVPEKPEPPVGATLTGRRTVGGSPWSDVPWSQIEEGRFNLVRRALVRLRRDCELAGLDVPGRVPRLSLLDDGGQVLASGPELPWNAAEDDFDYAKLEKAVGELTASQPGAVPQADGEWVGPIRPGSLRVTATRRA